MTRWLDVEALCEVRWGLLLLMLIVLPACQRGSSGAVVVEEMQTGPVPTLESWDVTLVMTDVPAGREQAQPRLALQSGYLAQFEEPDSTYLYLTPGTSGDAVRATLFDAAGDTSAVLLANELYYFDDDGRMEARGDVRVTTTGGRTLAGEHLRWLEATQRIRTDGFVQIETPTERIRGYGLDADENLDQFSLARVTGQVTVEEG